MTDRSTELTTILNALSHPIRLKMVECLINEGELSVGALAEPFDVSPAAISLHIRVLQKAGIVQRRLVRQRKMIKLRRGAIQLLSEWVNGLPSYVGLSSNNADGQRENTACVDKQAGWITQYVKETSVSIARSREELETALIGFGANNVSTSQDGNTACVSFEVRGRQIILKHPLPEPDDPMFLRTPHGRARRTQSSVTAAYQADCRRRWRALAQATKSKLVSIEHGVETLEDAFLAYIVDKDGRRVTDQLGVTG